MERRKCILKTRTRSLFICITAVIISINFIFLPDRAEARTSKDVILILDTSLSMKGYGGRNIFERVKKSIERYIDNLDDGDRVTFMTFDTDVRMYPTVFVDDDNDRDILKKYITMTEASGAWTYTYLMLKRAFAKADELEKDRDSRQTVLVVMTDAIDDPPPFGRHRRVNIKSLSEKYEGKDWWIYLVNLSELKKDRRFVAKREKLKKELSRVSSHTKIMDAGRNIEKVIEKDLREDVQRLEKEQEGIAVPLIIALLVIGVVLLAIYYGRQFSLLKAFGKLEYWNNDVIDPYIEKYDLGRRKIREITIGRGAGIILHINDISISRPFSVYAVRDSGDVKMALKTGEGTQVEFINRDPGEFLEDGDMFRVGNYTFKYFTA